MRGKIALVLIVMIICIGVGIQVNDLILNADIRRVERVANMDLPDNTKIEYKRDYHGWFGEGIDYVVFDIQESSPDFLDTFSLTKEDEKYEELRLQFEEDFDNALHMFDIEIDAKYTPTLNDSMYYRSVSAGGRVMYLVFDPERSELVVCEITE